MYINPTKIQVANIILWFVFGILYFFVDFKIDLNMPHFVRFPLGLTLFLGGRFIIYRARRIHKEVAVQPLKITKVITKGIFSRIRHPVYLGFILMNWGVFVIAFSWAFLMLSILFTIVWYFEARAEEKALCKRFPKKYGKYRREVPMLFPNLRS